MRRIVLSLSLSFFLLALTACGGGGISVSGNSKPTSASLSSGNWNVSATSQMLTLNGAEVILNFSGPLTGGSSAITLATNAGFFQKQTTFSGTQAEDKVTLTSAIIKANIQGTLVPVTVTITGTVYNGTNIDGTYTETGAATGDTTIYDKGTVQASYVPSISATWTGKQLEEAPDPGGNPDPLTANTATVSAAIAQATTPAIITYNGSTQSVFPLSGTFTFTDSVCFTSATIDSTKSFAVGNRVILNVVANDGTVIIGSTSYNGLDPVNLSITFSPQPDAQGDLPTCYSYLLKSTLARPLGSS